MIELQLLRSAFYVLYMHEQFHHKVESLGFRLLVTTGTDRYRSYKANVYRATYLTADCLEEALANADSFRRLSEDRYRRRVQPRIRQGLRRYLKNSFALQPPGYSEATRYLDDAAYRGGIQLLHSQALDGSLTTTTPPSDWLVAPKVIT